MKPQKPEFPTPRLIREDFLPDNPMNKYRIKKETNSEGTRYFPEVKFLLWWYNPFRSEPYLDGGYSPHRDGGYSTLEGAHKALCSHFKKTMVEYIDFDYERDCK